MNIFGLTISRTKAAPPVPVYENRGGWIPIIRESYTGAWQHNVTLDYNTILSNPVVFAVTSRITSDASSMPMYMEQIDGNGIWTEVENPAYSAVLRQPNLYQNHIQFKEAWFSSKLYKGNTYALKERDNRNVVSRLYVLDPTKVKPLVADDGSVYYQLSADNMAGGELPNDVVVPASEIIHDRFNCIFHPLIGVSPLYASGVAAMQGMAIQNSSTQFFNNNSQPGGILTAPGAISDETAARLKAAWDENYSGANAGKVAVLGDSLKFEKMTMTAQETDLIKQMQWTAEAICAVFHMPMFIAGFGPLPANSSVEQVMALYYSLCLRKFVVQFEACMNDGLNVGTKLRVQLDEDTLLRLDKTSLGKMIAEGIRGGFLAPNEGRKMDNRKPLAGGDTVYLQEQDHSLSALYIRDQGDDPFGKGAKAESPPEKTEEPLTDDEIEEAAKAYSYLALKAQPSPIQKMVTSSQ